jgi:hypothetical protein
MTTILAMAYIEPNDLDLIIAELRDRVQGMNPVDAPLPYNRAFTALIVAERAKKKGGGDDSSVRSR